MIITSFYFLVFVCLSLGVYYLLPRRPQNLWLLLISYAFVVSWDWTFALLLGLFCAVNYWLALLLARSASKKRSWLQTGIGINVLLLIFFRVTDFFLPELIALMGRLGIPFQPGAVQILVLAVVSTAQMDSTLFVDARDSLLLSNPLGMRLNDFYYDYTLYSAEAFKSLDQRLLRTCDLEDLRGTPLARSLGQALLSHDYLPVPGEAGADLTIGKLGDGLAFLHRGDMVLRTTASAFLADPGKALLEFCLKTDRYGFFRRFTFISLAIALPTTLYVLLYSLLRLVLSLFLAMGTAAVTAAALCSIIGLAPVVPVSSMRGAKIDPNHLADALQAPRWQERVAALRLAETRGLDLGNFPAHGKLTGSPHIAERYWLARAIGVSRQPETYREIIQLLDDPVKMLRKYHPIWFNTHFNHPNEITPESKRAVEMLVDGGIPVGNQQVLLKGVNDCPTITKKLCQDLTWIRGRPYYIYQCDIAKGLEHFRTSLGKGIEIIEAMRGHTSGFAVPQLVIDAPTGGGKIPVGPNYLISISDKRWILRNYEGGIFEFPEVEGDRMSKCPPSCKMCKDYPNVESKEGVAAVLSGKKMCLTPEGTQRDARRKESKEGHTPC